MTESVFQLKMLRALINGGVSRQTLADRLDVDLNDEQFRLELETAEKAGLIALSQRKTARKRVAAVAITTKGVEFLNTHSPEPSVAARRDYSYLKQKDYVTPVDNTPVRAGALDYKKIPSLQQTTPSVNLNRPQGRDFRSTSKVQ